MKARIINPELGKGLYKKENRDWLNKNIGSTHDCVRHNINYVRFSNGFICHIHECSIVD